VHSLAPGCAQARAQPDPEHSRSSDYTPLALTCLALDPRSCPASSAEGRTQMQCGHVSHLSGQQSTSAAEGRTQLQCGHVSHPSLTVSGQQSNVHASVEPLHSSPQHKLEHLRTGAKLGLNLQAQSKNAAP
jgi:hypothetical protein